MTNDLFISMLVFAGYMMVDFFIFKYFIHNRKGLIQIIAEKMCSGKKVHY